MRTLRVSLAGMVVALTVGLLPLGVAAQDGEISFPPDSGWWQGNVDLSGFVSHDTERDDGSYDLDVTDVIDDTHIGLAFVVGDDGQIARTGAVGELHVRGPTVMLGYWGTAPRRGTTGHHATGDLVVEEPDGTYRLLGRRARQVKSRGDRSEPFSGVAPPASGARCGWFVTGVTGS